MTRIEAVPTEAAVKVWVSDGPVDRWEMALRAGEDPRTLPDGGFFGFGVDRGTGCFFDAAAASALAHQTRQSGLGYEESRELTDDASGANLIEFHSGWATAATRSGSAVPLPATSPASSPTCSPSTS